MKKNFYKKLHIIVIIYLFSSFIYYFFGYYISLQKLDSSASYLSYKINRKYLNSYSSFYRWPKTITNYVNINNYRISIKGKYLNKLSEVFEYDLDDIIATKPHIKDMISNPSYQEYASQTYELLTNYKIPIIKDITKTIRESSILPDIKDIDDFTNDFICISCCYAIKKDSKTALLLSYLPILLINEIEANFLECSDPNYKMALMELRNKACMNLLFIADKIPIDKEISVKISKNLLELAKSEPPLHRYLDFIKVKIKYSFLNGNNKRTEYFYDHVYNSKVWKDTINLIYEGASKEIKNIESGGNPNSLYEWQISTHRFLYKWNKYKQENILYRYTNWQRLYTLAVIAKAPYTIFIDFYDLYKKREEYLALMEGTAIALALAAYSSDKSPDVDDIYSSMPKNVNELSKWLGVELPIDRVSKSPYLFYFADDYFLAGSPTNNIYAHSCFDSYLPFLRNRWVNHSQPTINGEPIAIISKPTEPEDKFSKKEKGKEIETKADNLSKKRKVFNKLK